MPAMQIFPGGVDYSTLSWVRPGIEETLAQAREALEAHVRDPSDAAQLSACVDALHQIKGTLTMMQTQSATRLANEMEATAAALREGRVQQVEDAQESLMRAMLQLPDYLEWLQSGKRDRPAILQPLIDDLRRSRGDATDPAGTAAPAAPGIEAKPDTEVRTLAGRVRPLYQSGLVNLLRDRIDPAAITRMLQALDILARSCRLPFAHRLWVLAGGLIESVSERGLALDLAGKRLLGQVDREIKRLADHGEADLDTTPDRTLLDNICALLQTSSTQGKRVAAARALPRPKTPPTHDTDSADEDDGEGLSGVNAQVLETVSTAIREDLAGIKDSLDLYARNASPAGTELAGLREPLRKVGDTLKMIGLRSGHAVVNAMNAVIGDAVTREQRLTDPALLELATGVLFVETALSALSEGRRESDGDADEVLSSLHRVSGDEAGPRGVTYSALPDSEFQHVSAAVMREAHIDIGRSKDAIAAFIDSPFDTQLLADIPELFGNIGGALALLRQEQAAALTDGVRVYIERRLLRGGSLPERGELEDLADAISGLEYYLEARQLNRRDADQVLSVAEQSLAHLGYPFPEIGEDSAPADDDTGIDDDAFLADLPDVDDIITAADATSGLAPSEADAAPSGDLAPGVAATTDDDTGVDSAAPAAPQQPGPPETDAPGIDTAPGSAAAPAIPTRISGLPELDGEADPDILDIFLEEADEERARIATLQPGWQQNPDDLARLTEIRRAYHTLKGSGRMVGAARLGEFAWSVENLLNRVLEGSVVAGERLIDTLDVASHRALPELIARLSDPTASSRADLDLIGAQLDALAYPGRPFPQRPTDAAALATASVDETADDAPVAAESAPEAAPDAPAVDAPATGDGARPEESDEFPTPEDDGAPRIDPVLYEIFRKETLGHLDTLNRFVADAREFGFPGRPSADLRRALHTILGSTRTTGITELSDLAGPLDRYIKDVGVNEELLTEADLGILTDSAGLFRESVLHLNDPDFRFPDIGAVLDAISNAFAARNEDRARRVELDDDEQILGIGDTEATENADAYPEETAPEPPAEAPVDVAGATSPPESTFVPDADATDTFATPDIPSHADSGADTVTTGDAGFVSAIDAPAAADTDFDAFPPDVPTEAFDHLGVHDAPGTPEPSFWTSEEIVLHGDEAPIPDTPFAAEPADNPVSWAPDDAQGRDRPDTDAATLTVLESDAGFVSEVDEPASDAASAHTDAGFDVGPPTAGETPDQALDDVGGIDALSEPPAAPTWDATPFADTPEHIAVAGAAPDLPVELHGEVEEISYDGLSAADWDQAGPIDLLDASGTPPVPADSLVAEDDTADVDFIVSPPSVEAAEVGLDRDTAPSPEESFAPSAFASPEHDAVPPWNAPGDASAPEPVFEAADEIASEAVESPDVAAFGDTEQESTFDAGDHKPAAWIPDASSDALPTSDPASAPATFSSFETIPATPGADVAFDVPPERFENLPDHVPPTADAGTVPAGGFQVVTDADLLDLFLEESTEILDAAESDLTRLQQAPGRADIIASLQRGLHTLKGGARMAALTPIGDLAHVLETLFENMSAGRIDANQDSLGMLSRCFDRLLGMIVETRGQGWITPADDVISAVEAFTRGERVTLPGDTGGALADTRQAPEAPIDVTIDAAPDAVPDAVVDADATPVATPIEVIRDEPVPETPAVEAPAAATPLRGEAEVAARSEQIRVRAEVLTNLVNMAGEISIFRARLEQQLGSFQFNIVELEQTVGRVRDQLRKLEIETETQILSRYQTELQDGNADFDPLELDRFSQLQQLSRALSEGMNDLINIQGALDSLASETETLLRQQGRVNSELQEGLMGLRMVPFTSIEPRLRRIVRQTSQELGKRAELVIAGGGSEIDRTILERMTAPLEHMLRNAIAHGIEPPAQRVAFGKPETGRITLRLAREGADVVIEVRDDGAGINLERLKAKAIERGLIGALDFLPDHELMQLLLESGFSTADNVSQIAGRGVGMDVVRSEIRQLSGTLDINSEPGRGAWFTVRLPFTLSVNKALLITVGDDPYAIPLAALDGVVRLSQEALQRSYGSDTPLYEYAGNSYALMHLGNLLGLTMPAILEDQDRVPVLLVRAGEQRVALQVDGLVGSREIVVKSLGPQLSSVPGIAGATILGDGRVVLILELGALVRIGRTAHANRMQEVAERKEREEPRVSVMVVDDSITMRKVATRLLERHNVHVLTAKDGIDALSQLQDTVPDVMLLDIEMPRMDGFELASHMRRDDRLKDVPIVMITSRTGEKHRERAAEIGVNEYMGKPYKKTELLQTILGLSRKSA